MKHIAIALLATLILAGCSHNEVPLDQPTKVAIEAWGDKWNLIIQTKYHEEMLDVLVENTGEADFHFDGSMIRYMDADKKVIGSRGVGLNATIYTFRGWWPYEDCPIGEKTRIGIPVKTGATYVGYGLPNEDLLFVLKVK